MRPPPPAPRTLLLIALVSILALAALSDFKPQEAGALAEIGGDGPATLSVIVVRCRPCSGGHLLNITDGEDGWADAFCPLDVYPSPIVNGSSVRLVVERSPSDPSFLYVQKVSVIAAPTGND